MVANKGGGNTEGGGKIPKVVADYHAAAPPKMSNKITKNVHQNVSWHAVFKIAILKNLEIPIKTGVYDQTFQSQMTS